METTTLAIDGYREQPVPNRFHRQDRYASQLAVVLPGFGYTCDMPLLYYTAGCLLAAGADVLQLDYDYSRRADFRALSAGERLDWLLADVAAACRAGIRQRDYRRVTLVGKSLGTRAMPHVLTEVAGYAAAGTIWLTPLWQEDAVRRQLLSRERPALVVIGTADPYYDAATADEVRAAIDGGLVVVDGAGHDLEISGDVIRSLRVLQRVIGAVRDFLEAGG